MKQANTHKNSIGNDQNKFTKFFQSQLPDNFHNIFFCKLFLLHVKGSLLH